MAWRTNCSTSLRIFWYNKSSGKEAPPEKIAALRERYGQYLYFSLSLSRDDQEVLNSVAGDRQAFGAMVNQLAFGMGEQVHLFTEKRDTIPLLDYVYPRMYGMSKSTSLLLVYPREGLEEAQSLTLTVKDLGFGTGEVGLRTELEKIKNQPTLHF